LEIKNKKPLKKVTWNKGFGWPFLLGAFKNKAQPKEEIAWEFKVQNKPGLMVKEPK